MKRLVIGVLAHVDAGKTTLCEGLLYTAGQLRRLGRVDHGDTCLDHEALERRRGITIFSKQAPLRLPEAELTLLDTPGHVDFSAEMERTLQVLDYAILVISGTDGVQAHTVTLWRLLRRYRIPAFVFVTIYCAATGKTMAEAEAEFAGQGYGVFKPAVGEAVIEKMRPIREEAERLMQDKAYLESIYKRGAEQAQYLANKTLRKVQKKIGFVAK